MNDDNGLTSFREIGEELGMTPQNVHKIYKQALKKLRKYLAVHPELREELRDWAKDLPEAPGRVSPADQRFPKIWDWVETPRPGDRKTQIKTGQALTFRKK